MSLITIDVESLTSRISCDKNASDVIVECIRGIYDGPSLLELGLPYQEDNDFYEYGSLCKVSQDPFDEEMMEVVILTGLLVEVIKNLKASKLAYTINSRPTPIALPTMQMDPALTTSEISTIQSILKWKRSTVDIEATRHQIIIKELLRNFYLSETTPKILVLVNDNQECRSTKRYLQEALDLNDEELLVFSIAEGTSDFITISTIDILDKVLNPLPSKSPKDETNNLQKQSYIRSYLKSIEVIITTTTNLDNRSIGVIKEVGANYRIGIGPNSNRIVEGLIGPPLSPVEVKSAPVEKPVEDLSLVCRRVILPLPALSEELTNFRFTTYDDGENSLYYELYNKAIISNPQVLSLIQSSADEGNGKVLIVSHTSFSSDYISQVDILLNNIPSAVRLDAPTNYSREPKPIDMASSIGITTIADIDRGLLVRDIRVIILVSQEPSSNGIIPRLANLLQGKVYLVDIAVDHPVLMEVSNTRCELLAREYSKPVDVRL